jgi:hypothetical protein
MLVIDPAAHDGRARRRRAEGHRGASRWWGIGKESIEMLKLAH